MISLTVGQKHVNLLCGRYSVEYLVANGMTIWKLRGTKVVPLKIVSQKDHLLTDKKILGN